VTVGSIGSPGSLLVEEIQEMSRGRMDFQSHTLTHPYLTKLNREGIKRELGESKEVLESKTGKSVHFLSIPNGTYNDTVKRVAKELGYLAKSDLYSLRRIAIKSGVTLPHFASLLKGHMLREKYMQSLRGTAKTALGIENYVLIRRWLLH
jgi:peptidoglycan/xylan/chitin deacetylase (PgdA/CDA1 family)